MYPYLELGGVELVNSDRALAYAARCGCVTLLEVCECEATPGYPYTDPEADPAPWMHAEASDSGSFQGVFVTGLELSAVPVRSVSAVGVGGAVGRMRPRHRVVTVSGLLVADAECGLEFGRRWLTDALAGGWRVEGCAADELRLLSCCPEDLSPLFLAEAVWKASEYEDADSHWRDLSGNGHHADIQQGTTNAPLHLRDVGGVQYARLDGVTGNKVEAPAPAGFTGKDTGTIELRARVLSDSYRPAIVDAVCASNNFRLRLDVTTAGRLQGVFNDGSARIGTSTVSLPDDTLTRWVSVVMDLDADTMTFRTSSDVTLDHTAVTWTQLGDVVSVTMGALAEISTLVVGAQNTGSGGETYKGRIYAAAWLLDGITVASPDFTDRSRITSPLQATFTDEQGNVWTRNQSATGRFLTYVTEPMWQRDGVDDFFQVAHHQALNPTGDFTIVYVGARPSASATATDLWSKTAGAESDGIRIGHETTIENLFARISDTTSSVAATNPNITPRAVETRALTRDGDTLRLRNGATEVTADATGIGAPATAVDLFLGRRAWEADGFVRDLVFGYAFFNRALTAAEIARVGEDLRS